MRWILLGSVGCGSAVAPECVDLDADACAAEPRCEGIGGTPASVEDPLDPEACWVPAGDEEILGCRDAEASCPPEVIFASDADGLLWYVPTGCTPNGFVEESWLPTCP